MYLADAVRAEDSVFWGVLTLFGGWNAALFLIKPDAEAYLEILREENYAPLIDWSHFAP